MNAQHEFCAPDRLHDPHEKVGRWKGIVNPARGGISSSVGNRKAVVGAVRKQEVFNVAVTRQSANRYLWSVGQSHRLNARPVDSVKPPDESEYLGEITDSMGLASTERAPDYTPDAGQL